MDQEQNMDQDMNNGAGAPAADDNMDNGQGAAEMPDADGDQEGDEDEETA